MAVAPQEVVGQFKEELDLAAATAHQASQQQAEAQQTHAEASSASEQADDELHSLRKVAAAAVEACDDSDAYETLAALLTIKGKPDEAVADYIEHLEAIRSTQGTLPVAIITGSSELNFSQPSVTYGRIVPPHTQLLVEWAGSGRALERNIVARVQDPRVLVGHEEAHKADAFAAKKQDGLYDDSEDTALELALNRGQPFEDIRFAATADRINEIIEQAGADRFALSEADQKIFRTFGIPAVAAYGDKAVAAVSERLVGRSDYYKLLVRRSLKGLGVSVEAVAEAEPTQHTRDRLRDDLMKELTEVLRLGGRYPTRQEISTGLSRLGFLGPLQSSLEIAPEWVLEELEGVLEQDIKVDGTTVRTKRGSRDDSLKDRLAYLVDMTKSYGLDVGNERRVTSTGYRLEESALRGKLSQTPKRKMKQRRQLRDAIEEVPAWGL